MIRNMVNEVAMGFFSISRAVSLRQVAWMWLCLALLVLHAEAGLFAQGRATGDSSIVAQERSWYYPEWLATAPYAPAFEVKDTLHKYGRYASQTKRITIEDFIKFHGHLCGGLVEAACALRVALDRLFADGIVDRTDLRIVSNNSACGGDVASYLTGARARFGSHSIDGSLKGGGFIVQRVSTAETVRVTRNPEIYPSEVKAQMKKIQSGSFSPKDIDLFGKLQWAYAGRLVKKPLSGSFLVEEIKGYAWPEPVCRDLGKRKDNDYRNVRQQ